MKDPEKFLRKVKKTESCWLWEGSLFRLGYGRVRREDKIQSAHRVSYKMFVGEIPPGMELDHLCSNKSCVNPNHLEPVTHLENIRRAFPAKPTVCPAGHSYEKTNTYVNPKGQNVCKKCMRRHESEYRARQKAKVQR